MPSPAYYLTASGRISRREYWLLFNLPIFILYIIAVGLMASGSTVLTIVALCIYVPIIVISIFGNIRRLHDRDQSGWWYLLNFTGIGAIYLFVVLGFLRGTIGSNRFGADPVTTR